MKPRIPFILTACLLHGLYFAGIAAAAPPAREVLHEAWLTSGELVWRRVETETPAPALRARSLFTLALIYCETGQHRDRLPRLIATAGEMQVTDAAQPDFGNFRWQWQHPGVVDPNAVEFCMRTATLLWKRHQQSLSEPVREPLLELMRRGARACERRLVEPAYTNIALMNANNLILLGEILSDPRLTAAGQRRFRAVTELAGDFGFMEYESPTYLGVTINILQQLATCPSNPDVRLSAQALLDLAWLQVAANWLPDTARLAGSYSRSYDYLQGSGELEAALWAAGWIAQPPDTVRYSVYAIAGGTPLPDSAEQVLRRQKIDLRFPRLIEQRVGPAPRQTRTTWIGRQVALGTSGADYGTTDVPLAIDFRAARHARSYLTFDDRGDIFSEYPFERGGHVKAEHVRPFWTSVQRNGDAIGLAVFAAEPPGEPRELAAAMVLPSLVDGAWVNGRPYAIGEPTLPHRVPLPDRSSIVLRSGRAAMGVKFLESRNRQGTPGQLSLRRTDDALEAVALVVDLNGEEHREPAWVVVWVRVADDLSDEAFAKWRRHFDQIAPDVIADPHNGSIDIPFRAEELRLTARSPWDERSEIDRLPVPCRKPLSINGADVGRALLAPGPYLRDKPQQGLPAPVEDAWLAGKHVVLGVPMQIDSETQAIGTPAELGISVEIAARAGWHVRVPASGRYRLWAESFAPSTAANSFYFRLSPVKADDVAKTYWGVWSLPPAADFQTYAVKLEETLPEGLFELSRGDYRLDIFAREPGASVRSWRLTRDIDWRPQ